MKCKIFIGTWSEAQNAFNDWAKDKALAKDIIIHEIVLGQCYAIERAKIAIIIYHPNNAYWDRTEPQPDTPITIQQAREREAEQEKNDL